MMGGGYVVSGDVAASLVNINRNMKLKVGRPALRPWHARTSVGRCVASIRGS